MPTPRSRRPLSTTSLLIQQVLDEYTTAPISEGLRATLGLLEKVTLDHGSLGPEDVRTVMRAGVSKQAIQEATGSRVLVQYL